VRIAVISCIHGNYEALDAVLLDGNGQWATDRKVDKCGEVNKFTNQ
jgi:hypothetical protein